MRFTAAIVSAAALAALTSAAAGGSSSAYRTPATRSARTAVYFTEDGLSSSDVDLYMQRVRDTGATYVRVIANWAAIAPRKRPPGFDPANPADPAYRWGYADELIKSARDHGLEPMVTLFLAPRWAGRLRVSPTQFGLFARAAARRYSGTFQRLPRVRYWLMWNEPNLARYLSPQYTHHHRRLVSVSRYRKMVNAAAAPIHAVHRDNVVVAGELAPLDTPRAPGSMKFTRAALCVSAELRSTCKTSWHFDIWSTHPYTSGGPTHKAFGADGVALGNLPQLRRIVRAAVRFHHVHAPHGVQLWNTEFGWNTKPPCRTGVPMKLAERWVAESVYRNWKSHATLYTWYQLVDFARGNPFQTGLYFRGRTFPKAHPKPILPAFRFPFVAFKHGSHVFIWGRTPDGQSHTIRIQRSRAHGWATISTLIANKSGIFFRTLSLHHAKQSWRLRAFQLGSRNHSPGFSLHYIGDRYYKPFGCS